MGVARDRDGADNVDVVRNIKEGEGGLVGERLTGVVGVYENNSGLNQRA